MSEEQADLKEEHRINPNPFDIAAILAIAYTIGYFGVVFVTMFYGLPDDNKDTLNQLIGGLTIIQTGIISFYFGGSKQAEATQRASEQRQGRTDAVVQKAIEKIAPAELAPNGKSVVTPAAENPATGNTPAAEVQPKGEVKL